MITGGKEERIETNSAINDATAIEKYVSYEGLFLKLASVS